MLGKLRLKVKEVFTKIKEVFKKPIVHVVVVACGAAILGYMFGSHSRDDRYASGRIAGFRAAMDEFYVNTFGDDVMNHTIFVGMPENFEIDIVTHKAYTEVIPLNQESADFIARIESTNENPIFTTTKRNGGWW